MKKKLPTFLGIGVPKAGTSWLHQKLMLHPEVWLPPNKEIKFFTNRSLPQNVSPFTRIFSSSEERARIIRNLKNLNKHLFNGNFERVIWGLKWNFGYYNEGWYVSLFPKNSSYLACGEITPEYAFLPEKDILRIKKINPDIKLILILRHPAERAWSAFRFYNRKKSDLSSLDDDEIINTLNSPHILHQGDYEPILNTFLRYFDSQQILVCFYDAIISDQVELMNQVAQFLGISNYQEEKLDNQEYFNASPTLNISPKIQEYLLETYTPITEGLAKRLGGYAVVWHETGRTYHQELDKAYPKEKLLPTLHP